MFEKSLVAAAVLLGAADVTHAQNEPGSLLVYPVFNNREGFITLITVTNTSKTRDIEVRFNYSEEQSCHRIDYNHYLTPLDTFSCLTRAHNPHHDGSRGYLTVHARSTFNGEQVKFDNLVGSSLVIDGLNVGSYAVNPFVFRGIGNGDLNGNGQLDLNGVEYSMAPAKIIIPRFLGQPDNYSTSSLILIDAAGGAGWHPRVELLVMNDNEEQFSLEHGFRCWNMIGLQDLSLLFTNSFLQNNTNHDPEEVFGYPQLEAGWFWVTGIESYKEGVGVILDPAILAVLVEPTTSLQTAAAPFAVGQRDNGIFDIN